MTIPDRVVSDYTNIKFDVCGKSYIFLSKEAYGFVQGLEASAAKASLQFTEVVACRSIMVLKPDRSINHQQVMWISKGPYSSDQFLSLLSFKEGISSKEWYDHMHLFCLSHSVAPLRIIP